MQVSRFVSHFLPTSQTPLEKLVADRNAIVMAAHRKTTVDGFAVNLQSVEVQTVLRSLAQAIRARKEAQDDRQRRPRMGDSPLRNKTSDNREEREARAKAKSKAMQTYRSKCAPVKGGNKDTSKDPADELTDADRKLLGL